MRTIEFDINDKKVLVQKDDRYIKEDEIRLVIEDIVKSNVELSTNKKISLENLCDCFFSIVFKGIITTIQNINNKEIPITNMVFEIC